MPDDTLRVRVLWEGNAGQGYAYNVIHLQGPDAGDLDQTMVDAIAGDLDSAFGSGWNDAIHEDVQLSTIFVAQLTDPIGPEFVETLHLFGNVSGDKLPAQLSVVTSLRTAHGGRSGRGRIYNAGLPEAANEPGGTIAAGYTEAINGGWEDFNSALSTQTFDLQMAVYSRVEEESFRVTSFQTNNTWDTQRRRVH